VLARTKTDAADARRIARFCAAHELVPWTPAPAEQQRLRALVTARDTLVQEQLRLRNRQHAAGYTACAELVAELQAPVLAAIAAQIARVDADLAALGRAETALGERLRLLTGVPGLGLTTAAVLLASLPLDRLRSPRQVAAYVGLCPQERSSGSSIRGRGRIGPLGPAHLRKALYMPAVVAMRCNPALRTFRRAAPRGRQAPQGRHHRGDAQAAPARRRPPPLRPALLPHPPRGAARRRLSRPPARRPPAGRSRTLEGVPGAARGPAQRRAPSLTPTPTPYVAIAQPTRRLGRRARRFSS
jgi:transposase